MTARHDALRERRQIADLYRGGRTIRVIAEILGRHPDTIRAVVARLPATPTPAPLSYQWQAPAGPWWAPDPEGAP